MKTKLFLFFCGLLFSLTSFAQAQMRNENAKIVVSAGVSLRVSGALDQRQNAGITNHGTLFISGAATQRNTSTIQTQNIGASTLQGTLTLLGTSSLNNAGSTEVRGDVLHQGAGTTTQNTGFMTVWGNFDLATSTTSLNNGSLFVSANWINNAADNAFSGTGKVQFYGIGTVTLGGDFNTNFHNLEINRVFLTASKNAFIANNLNFISGTAFFQTAGVLASTATVTNEANKRYATGILLTERNITATETFGGMGVTLNPLGQNLGQITLVRKAGGGISEIHLEKNSINRTWEFITTASNLFSTVFATVNLSFSWLSDDDNGVDLTDTHIWHKPPQKKGAWIGMTMPANNSLRTVSNLSTYSLDYINNVQSNALNKYTVGGVGNIRLYGTITEIGVGLPFVSVTASNGNFGITNYEGFYSVTHRAGFQGTITPTKRDAVGDWYVFTSAGLRFISVFEDIYDRDFTAMGKYFVKGKVLEIDRPLENTKISIIDPAYFTTVTDIHGDFTAFVSSGFTFSVTADKTPYFFTANPRTLKNQLQHHLHINFSAMRTYDIQGRVTEEGIGIANTQITTNVGFTTVTDAYGFYLTFVSSGYNGFISATKKDYFFEPVAHSYTKVLEPHSKKDYKASRLYAIEGRITEGGLPFEATISLDNKFTTVSDKNGFYVAFVSSGYTGLIRPQKTGFVFSPPFLGLEKILSERKQVDFQAFALYGISGQVLKDGVGFSSVTITTSNGDAVLTDQNGFYTAFVSSGYTGQLKASKTGYYFEPSALSFASIIGFQTVPTFKAHGLQPIYGKIEFEGKPLKGVKVISSEGDVYETDENGFYTAFVSANGSTTLTFEKEHHIFEPSSLSFTSVTGTTNVNVNLQTRLVEYPIWGQVLLNNTKPLAGVKIHAASFTTVTDQNGFYTVFQKAGFKGKIIPDSTQDYFEPPFMTVENVFATVNKINFGAKTADISLKTQGTAIEKDGKIVYCSNVEYSINMEKIPAHSQDSLTYLWSDGSRKPTFTATETGLYFVTVKVPKFYPTGLEKQVELDINRLVVKWGKDSTLCIGTKIDLASDPKALTRRWQQKNGSNYQDLTNATAANQTVGEGVYRLQMSNGTCEVSYEISLKYAPEQPFTSIEKLYYFCNDSEPVRVSAKNEHSAKYAWTAEGFTSDKAEVLLTKGGNYKLVATDKYGCTKEAFLTVNDQQRLENIFLFKSEVRVGDTVVFINISRPLDLNNPAPTKAEWDLGGLSKSSNLETVEQIFEKTGSYSIKLAVSNGYCQTIRSKTLKVVPMPEGGRAEKVYPQETFTQAIAQIYPNPAKDQVKIRLHDFSVKSVNLTVFDSYGRQMLSREIDSKTEQTVDCTNWATGVYLVRIISGKVVKTLRFSKD